MNRPQVPRTKIKHIIPWFKDQKRSGIKIEKSYKKLMIIKNSVILFRFFKYFSNKKYWKFTKNIKQLVQDSGVVSNI